MPRVCIILSVYNRVDDLLVHLEILKHYPFPHEVIIVFLDEHTETSYLEATKDYHQIFLKGLSFATGPLLSLVYGVREAHRLGMHYVVYRNADDWLFNGQFVKQNFLRLAEGPYYCAGYNWLSHESRTEFALNELYMDVARFMKHIEDAEDYFLRADPEWLCEFKVTRWIVHALDDFETQFYRFRDRERDPAIGHDRYALEYIYRHFVKEEPPEDLWIAYETNNRNFHKDWQLIGSHDNQERWDYWQQIRHQVPYAAQLETSAIFRKWVEAVKNNDTWNKISENEAKQEEKILEKKTMTRRMFKKRK